MVVQTILVAAGSYLLGSVPAAYLAVRWAHGRDIRQMGTGNVGTSNVLSIGPKWMALPVAVFDTGKGAVCVWVAGQVGLDTAWQIGAGLLAIIGHNWPIFLRFRGGRGIFASLGVITMLSPRLGLIILVTPYLFAIVRQLAFGVFLGLVSLGFFGWFLTDPLGIDERLPVTMGLVAIGVTGLAKRLFGRRRPLSRSLPWRRVIVNRLLFDRDITDRRAWIQGAESGLNCLDITPDQPEKGDPGELLP